MDAGNTWSGAGLAIRKKSALLYCRSHHNGTSLCSDCQQLLDYADSNIKTDSILDLNPMCDKSETDCHDKNMHSQWQTIIKWSWPRMCLRHPFLMLAWFVYANLRLVLVVAGMGGVLLGVGGFTFLYAEGLSYMSSDPLVCVNCHIMQPRYDSWVQSSHHAVANCVDCHLPHNLVGKYLAKAENGYRHSKAFTLQNFHEPIMINEKNSQYLRENCVACHLDVVEDMQLRADVDHIDEAQCMHCHIQVGHGEIIGLGGPDRGELLEGEGK